MARTNVESILESRAGCVPFPIPPAGLGLLIPISDFMNSLADLIELLFGRQRADAAIAFFASCGHTRWDGRGGWRRLRGGGARSARGESTEGGGIGVWSMLRHAVYPMLTPTFDPLNLPLAGAPAAPATTGTCINHGRELTVIFLV